MAGLEALAAILGGLGTGSAEGYETGVNQALKQKQMAEQQRQFDLAHMVDTDVLAKAIPGFPSMGRQSNATANLAENAFQKNKALELADTSARATASSIRDMANQYGQPEMANPEAAGTSAPASSVVTPKTPQHDLMTFARWADEGRMPKEAATAVDKWLTNKRLADNSTPTQIVQDVNGDFQAVPKPKNLTGPTPVGVTGMKNRNALDQAITAYQRDPSLANKERVDLELRAVVAGPDTEIYKGTDVLGAKRPGAAPAPAAVNAPPPPPLAQVPSTPQPAVKRAPTEPPGELDKNALGVSYLTRVSALADSLEKFHQSRSKGQNVSLAVQNTLQAMDPTGKIAKATIPLDKNVEEIKAQAEALLRDYEAAKGGMRAVSGPQIQAALTSVHGGDISNPNGYIQLRNLADAELDYLKTRGKLAPVHGRRDTTSGSAADYEQAQKNKPPAPVPSGFAEWLMRERR